MATTVQQPASPSSPRVSIDRLPISPRAPIYHLPPDPLFPTPDSLLSLSTYKSPKEETDHNAATRTPPSMLRRARMIRDGGCFTFVSPLPLDFPYNTRELNKDLVDESLTDEQREAETVEDVLAKFELDEHAAVARGDDGQPTAFQGKGRKAQTWPKPRLLALSQRCRDEWLPQLDVGQPGSKERDLLVDVLGGRTVVAHKGDLGFAPWSLCYGGHQFGSWASQLGDGRAISIMSTPASKQVHDSTGFPTIELQLKGAGRTPYSRFADGLAVLRSSVREFLGSEAMYALGQPTSRSLALVGLPDVKVRRETMETAAIVTRVASSWIRIGNFEIQNSNQEWESLRKLTTYVAREVFCLEQPDPESTSRSMSLAILRQVARRNAVMIAGWQAYGFMHGVMNTDNIAVTGACIDYGPYAFMDVFDSAHICNHSDDFGRYSFKNQPTMGLFAVAKLADALAESIGCELALEAEAGSGQTGFVQVEDGWGREGVEKGLMQGWREKGLEQLEAVKDEFIDVFKTEYTRLMRLRLGLETAQDGDFDLVSGILDLMELHSLDFTNTFRLLSQFPGSTDDALYSKFIDELLPASATTTLPPNARNDWKGWFDKYASRIRAESSSEDRAARRLRMNAVNPRFTLRQWVLEETIKSLDHQRGPTTMLERVLDMASQPFDTYGEVDLTSGACEILDDEAKERQRLCGIGSNAYLGFQCSCSS